MLRSAARSRRRPTVAVAHLDHPALVITEGGSGEVAAELRGGLHPQYLDQAPVEIGSVRGRVTSYDPATHRALLGVKDRVEEGAIARWQFRQTSLGIVEGVLSARACDDLAGAAAALAALDLAAKTGINHFSVLLTRAEEVGFIGAIAACKLGTIPAEARVLSIECSRSSADAPLGGGPVVRVGDAASVFSAELTNQVSAAVKDTGIRYQRKLMAGGSCEATAFCAYGYEASGLCLPLDNYHNMVDIDGVLAGRRRARLGPERIDLADFQGLVDLLVVVAGKLDAQQGTLRQWLDDLYDEGQDVLALTHPA